MPRDSDIVAVVQDVCNGKHGRYAVATSEAIKGSITFSLDSAWKESELPESGTFIVLNGLRKKKAGWRATSARFLNLSDEKEVKK